MKLNTLAVVVLFLIFSTNVDAIVNMDNLHLKSSKNGISGSVKLNSSGAYGNSERFRVSTGAELYAKQKQSLNFGSFSYSYGESFAKEDQNKSYAHLRHINNIESDTSWEIFTQIERNKFSRLNFRGLLGGGFRWNFLSNSELDVSIVGVGAYYSKEYLTDNASSISEERDLNLMRGNFYWVFRANVFEGVTFFNTTYYQPNLESGEDFRVLEIAGFKFSFSKNLRLNLYGEGTFDRKPPVGVKKTDIAYKTGLEYKF